MRREWNRYNSRGAFLTIDSAPGPPSIASGGSMDWEPPAFDEIKMDAELTAYCEDLDAEAAPGRDAGAVACEPPT
jgi:hypothetical protein